MAGPTRKTPLLPTGDRPAQLCRPAGLESLGDWAAPADSPYGCALYSTNGGALITASTHPYTYQDYVGTAPVSSDRWYYSPDPPARTEDQLPGVGGGPPAAAIQPLPSPSVEGGPAGPDEGQAPAAAHSRAKSGGGVPDAPRRLAPTSLPGLPPAETPAAVNTRGGSRPSLRTEPLTGAPPGRACPAPTARRPGTAARVNPTVFPYRSVGGAPHPAATFRHRPSPGKFRRGRRPRRPAKPPKPTAIPPGSHPRRGQDPSLQTDPQTSALR